MVLTHFRISPEKRSYLHFLVTRSSTCLKSLWNLSPIEIVYYAICNERRTEDADDIGDLAVTRWKPCVSADHTKRLFFTSYFLMLEKNGDKRTKPWKARILQGKKAATSNTEGSASLLFFYQRFKICNYQQRHCWFKGKPVFKGRKQIDRRLKCSSWMTKLLRYTW